MDLFFQLHQLVAEWNVLALALLGFVAGQVAREQELARERAFSRATTAFQQTGVYPLPGEYVKFESFPPRKSQGRFYAGSPGRNFDPFIQGYFNRTEPNVPTTGWPGMQLVFSATPDAALPSAPEPDGWLPWRRIIHPRDPSRAWLAISAPPPHWGECGDFFSCYGQGIFAVATLVTAGA